MSFRIDYDDDKHKYWLDGEEVPSVTAITDVLKNEALTWWGFRVGLAAGMEVCKQGKVSWPELISQEFQPIVDGEPLESDRHQIRGKGKFRTLLEHWAVILGLHPNAMRDKAATRGTSIHTCLENLGMGVVPSLADFPEEDRGYVQGLCSWWIDQEPEIVEQEKIVGSKKHMYAGRFDLLIRDSQDRLVLTDLKTSKRVYPDSQFRQLMGYAIAFREMGGEPLHRLEVLNVNKDGSYRVVTAKVREHHFLDTLAQYRSIKDFDACQKLDFQPFDESYRAQLELEDAA